MSRKPPRVKSATVTVDFMVEVPDSTTSRQLRDITLELGRLSRIKVQSLGEHVKGASVLAHTTTAVHLDSQF